MELNFDSNTESLKAIRLNETEGSFYARMHLVTMVLSTAGDVDVEEVLEILGTGSEVETIDCPELLAVFALVDSITLVRKRPEFVRTAQAVYGAFLRLLPLDPKMNDNIEWFCQPLNGE